MHKLEFLSPKWVVVEKFHEYLYGSIFNVYTDNNPLTYILTTAKLDAASHWWVSSLASYNFWFHYQARKANIDADALLRVSWLGCMPDDSGTHLKVTAAAVQTVQEAALEGPASPIEAYSYDLHVLDTVQDSQQVTCMTLEDWHQAQQADLTLSLVITRLWDETLVQQWSKPTNPPKYGQFLWEHIHLLFKQGVLYRWARPRESEETFFKLVLPATQREISLKGCHDEVCHFGLECMVNLMQDRFDWPCMAAQAKEHISKCCPCLAFKAKQPNAPLENIMATHPLELVHLDFLCLEPGKGLKENILVVTDHFTRYAQVYVTRTQTAQTTTRTLWDKFIVHYGLPEKTCWTKVTTLRVSWWLTSVSWWVCRKYRPVCTIHRPMASVKASILPWLICCECYPPRRIRVEEPYWNIGLAPKLWQHQIWPNSYRKWGNVPNGLKKGWSLPSEGSQMPQMQLWQMQ